MDRVRGAGRAHRFDLQGARAVAERVRAQYARATVCTRKEEVERGWGAMKTGGG